MAAEGREKKGAMEAKAVADAGFIFLKDFNGADRRVSKAAASLSGLIRGMIEEDGCADGGVVDLPRRVAASTLDKVLEYCNKHAEPSVAAASAKPRFDPAAAAAGGSGGGGAAAPGDLEAWDRKFLGLLSLDDLYDLLLAASYLHKSSCYSTPPARRSPT
ncbi:unnamed protein product [Urochloa humidicola]